MRESPDSKKASRLALSAFREELQLGKTVSYYCQIWENFS